MRRATFSPQPNPEARNPRGRGAAVPSALELHRNTRAGSIALRSSSGSVEEASWVGIVLLGRENLALYYWAEKIKSFRQQFDRQRKFKSVQNFPEILQNDPLKLPKVKFTKRKLESARKYPASEEVNSSREVLLGIVFFRTSSY